MLRSFALTLLMLLGSAEAFAPVNQHARASTSSSALQMANNSKDGGKKTAASFLTAAYILANVVSVAPAAEAAYFDDHDFAGSSQVVAARSGGRMGGRSAVGSRSSSAPSYSSKSSVRSTTVVRPTTVIQTGPSVVASPYGYGYGYDPMPGLGKFVSLSFFLLSQKGSFKNDMTHLFYHGSMNRSSGKIQCNNSQNTVVGLSLGLSAINSVGNGIREYRQESEIAQGRAELEQARIKQAELEARLRMLEARPAAP